MALALKLEGNSNAGTGLVAGKRYSIAGQNVKVYAKFRIKMARISYSLVPHIPNIAHVWEYPTQPTPPPLQGRRRNRYRPSCLIRDFLKAASTDTAQTTSTEKQLSGFLFSFVCNPFFFIASCMKECESTKLETLVVKQKITGQFVYRCL